MANYIDELNESQRQAVLYCDGPEQVIAGAGSGKTRVLTYKIAYLLEQGYNPWEILALTFTNKAAREMKERISVQVGGQRARYLWMGTFHSMFLRILHAEARVLGFSSQFTVYDASDTKSLVRSIMKEMGLDEKVYKPGHVLGRISNAKNRLVTPPAYAASREALEYDREAKMPLIHEIYCKYWERCRQADAMDFDDLLLYTFLLFRDHPEVLARYQTQFKYILVDEYQDTNFAQHSIVLQLAQCHQHVCVVGDDAQSIYSFRGANINNILSFTKVYTGTRVFKLEQNYRSTQMIVNAANSLIAKNVHQIPKTVFSENQLGDSISLFQAYSDIEEGEIVVNQIIKLRRYAGCEFSDFAILYRTNAQSRIFEEALRKRNMPYRIYGGLSFYQRKEVKDVIAYFRLIVNPNDEEALKRIINYPTRGIGVTTVNKIVAAAADNGVSLWTVLCEPLSYGLSFNKGTQTKLQDFKGLIEELMGHAGQLDAYESGVEIIRQSGVMNDIQQDSSPEGLSRKENIDELINGLNEFCGRRREEGTEDVSLVAFLSEVSLLSDLDQDTPEEEQARVTLMTVHSAKGLEFKNVFVVGMEEALFPGSMAGDSAYAIEEERRLFYVAITRAEERCFLSYAKSRYRYGKMEFCAPSRFLKDIDAQFVRTGEQGVGKSYGSQGSSYGSQYGSQGSSYASQLSNPVSSSTTSSTASSVSPRLKRIAPAGKAGASVPASAASVTSTASSTTASRKSSLKPGQLIEHERFGVGEVLQVESAGDTEKATIRFQNAGVKQLLLRFARFKVIG